MVALWVIFASTSLPQRGLWMLSAAMVTGGGAPLARSRFVSQPRLLAVTTGCLAATERVKGDETTSYADWMSASRLGSLIHATSGSFGGVGG